MTLSQPMGQTALSLVHLGAILGAAGWGLAAVGGSLRRGSASLPGAEAFALVLVWGVTVVAIAALALADAGRFSIVWIDAAAVACGLAGLAARTARRTGRPSLLWKEDRPVAWLAPILCAAAVFFARPFQYMKGAWDPGVYTAMAANAARMGSLTVRDALLPQIPSEDRVLLYHRRVKRPQLYPGFLVADAEHGLLKPSFYHLYPAWAAVFFSLFGLHGIFWANYLPALGGVLLLYLLARRVFSAPAAWLACLFLVLSPAQIYFARFQTSEVLSQFFLLAAFWSLCCAAQEDSAAGLFAEITAATCLGAAVLVHSTNLLPALCLFISWPALAHKPGGVRWRFPALLAAALALAFLRNWMQARDVTTWLAGAFLRKGTSIRLFAAGFSLLAAAVIFCLARRKAPAGAAAAKEAFGTFASALILLALLAGYFVRPRLGSGPNAMNLPLLGWVVSPGVLALAAAFFIAHRPDRWSFSQTLFILPAGLVGATFLVDKMISPLLAYAARRYVPVLLPLTVTLAAAAAVALFQRWRGAIPRALVAAVCAAGVAYELCATAPVLAVCEERGLAAFYASVAALLRGGDLVFCDHDNHASPLRFAFGLPSYALGRQDEENGVEFARGRMEYLRRWVREGKKVFYVADGGLFFDPEIRLEEVGRVTAETRRLERRYDRWPRRIVSDVQNAVIYRLDARDAEPAELPAEATLEVGHHALGLVSGFHGAGRSGEISYRWTDGRGELYIPCYGREAPTEILLHMAAKRLRTNAVVMAEIRVEDRVLDRIPVSQDWADHCVVIPERFWEEDAPAVVKLGIHTDTWNPAEDGLHGYPTNLGVRLARVKVRRIRGS